jgi:hypothetical protein
MIRARGARYRARCFAVGEQTLAVGSCRRPLAADNSVRKAQSAVICRKSLNAVSEDAEIVRDEMDALEERRRNAPDW